MEQFDLAIGWLWEFDEPFVRQLEHEAQSRRRLKTFSIHEANFREVQTALRQNKLQFRTYLDRAFDEEPAFERIGRLVASRGGTVVNPYDRTIEAVDKATMHLQFLEAGLHVPFTIIISPYSKVQNIELTFNDLAHLGRPFIIKPANTTGGGIGVVHGAETVLDVIQTRTELEEDKYLLQEKIYPRIVEGRRCWFRCFYVFGKVFLAWWDDQTHVYELVTTEEEHYYKLRRLRSIMRTIANVSGLSFFSSEIALRETTPFDRRRSTASESQFVVVDYVNDMCDMRSLDEAHDGLPNLLRDRIVERLAHSVAKLATG